MEITDRAIDFMERSAAAKKPFYAYVPYTLVHYSDAAIGRIQRQYRTWGLGRLPCPDGSQRGTPARHR